ncbi:hypothetical protein [Streptomyces scabiei]|uniref:hypothetical protein n=1 Tax=Streptomyces scabiei TaxID=1930 RepID=UPI001B322CF8|nr:hypothetical protein [Streptomyces sp. LBUM 1487]MBP5888628.1 hypothetical protein [Streptomyces sp. LBUM 1487]
MTYSPGRKQRFDLQVYYNGAWRSSGSEYFALGTNGKSAVALEAPGQSGIRARMRSVYIKVRPRQRQLDHLRGWKYLYFSK